MQFLIASVTLSIFAACAVWFVSRKDPAGKAWLPAVTLFFLAVLPLIALLPKYHIECLPLIEQQASSVTTRNEANYPIVLLLWLLIAGVLLTKFTWQHIRLHRWLRECKEMGAYKSEWFKLLQGCKNQLGIKNNLNIRSHDKISSPVITGILQPTIVIPQSASKWDKNTKKMALLHELAHLKRKDLWIRFAANLACILHWYNPLVWWLKNKLISQCEFACDAYVISSGADKKTYLTALCDVVEEAIKSKQSHIPEGAYAMSDHVPLSLRAEKILSNTTQKTSWLCGTATIFTTTLALGITLIYPTAKQALPSRSSIFNEDINEVKTKRDYTIQEINLRHSADPFPGN